MMSSTMWYGSSTTMYNKETKQKTAHGDEIHLLQAEAEKIRNWHVQTEMNTKRLEKMVQNLNLTVESQRKSLLEVQLEYECIGNKMQEEINKRSSCLQKIDATRDMCNLLKMQACELEDTVNFCSNVKEQIETRNKEQSCTVEQLSEDFNKLSANFDSLKLEHASELSLIHQKTEEDRNILLKEINAKSDEIDDCIKQLEQKASVIEALSQNAIDEHNRLNQSIACNNSLRLSNKELKSDLEQLKLNDKHLQSVKKDLLILLDIKEKKLLTNEESFKMLTIVNDQLQQQVNIECSKLEEAKSSFVIKTTELEKKNLEQTQNIEAYERLICEKNNELQSHMQTKNELEKVSHEMELKVLKLTDERNALLMKYSKLEELQNANHCLLDEKTAEINQLRQKIMEMEAIEANLQKHVKEASSVQKQVETEAQESSLQIKELNQQLKENITLIEDFKEEIKLLKIKQSEFETINRQASLEMNELKSSLQTSEEMLLKSTKHEDEMFSNIQLLEKNIEEYKLKSEEYDDQLKAKDEQIAVFEGNIKKKQVAIDDQVTALNLSTQLYNELLIIRNDQALEIAKLSKELKTTTEKLEKEQQTNLTKLQQLNVDHAQEIEKLQKDLQCAKDKVDLLQTESNNTSQVFPSRIFKAKRSKMHRITPLNGHDVSDNFHEGLTPINNYSKPKQHPPKHSTPVQRVSKPTHYSATGGKFVKKTSCKRTPSWKQRLSKASTKTTKKQSNTKTTVRDENWFDTDRVYGFFE